VQRAAEDRAIRDHRITEDGMRPDGSLAGVAAILTVPPYRPSR
jgi:hypothetical protein